LAEHDRVLHRLKVRVVVVEPVGRLRLDLEQAGSSVARIEVRRVVGMSESFVRTAEDRLPDQRLSSLTWRSTCRSPSLPG
jgi:hypothetical protein